MNETLQKVNTGLLLLAVALLAWIAVMHRPNEVGRFLRNPDNVFLAFDTVTGRACRTSERGIPNKELPVCSDLAAD